MLLFLLLYVLLQMGIGVLVSRRVRTEDDYLVAGRSLGPALVTCSLFATWFGAESCLGAAGTVYDEGISHLSAEPFAYGLCLVVMGLFYAVPLWRRGITTLADLFRKRYGAGIETLAAVLLIPTSVLWAAAQVRAFGHVLHTNGDGWISVEAGILVATLVAVVYTGAGGLLADVITDVVQGGALVLGLIVLLWGAIEHVGGIERAAEVIAARPDLGVSSAGFLHTLEAWMLPLAGSVVAQEAVARALAARNPQIARRGAVTGGLLYVAVGMIPVTLGLLGPTLVPELDGGDTEQLLPTLAARHLPAALNVIFAGALVSAILSTVDSCLLVASSLFSRNVVLRGGRNATDARRLWMARCGVMGAGVCACLLALEFDSVAELVADASGFGSAGIFVIVTMGLFTRLGGRIAALGALVLGLLSWVAGRYVWSWPDDGNPQGLAIEHPYLISFASAWVGYALGMLVERLRPPAPTEANPSS